MRYKEVKRKVIEEKHEYTKIFCDICHKDVNHASQTYGNSCSNELTYVTGDCWPECDATRIHVLDVCGKCFFCTIKPLIEAHLEVKFKTLYTEENYPKYRGVEEKT